MITKNSENAAAAYLAKIGKTLATTTEKEDRTYWSILHGGDKGEAHGRKILNHQIELEATGSSDLIPYSEKVIDAEVS